MEYEILTLAMHLKEGWVTPATWGVIMTLGNWRIGLRGSVQAISLPNPPKWPNFTLL